MHPSTHMPLCPSVCPEGAGGQGSRIREAERTRWGQPAEPRTLPGSVSARSELRSFLEPSAATTPTPTPTDGFLCHAYPLGVGAPGRQRPQLALLVSDPSPRSWRGWGGQPPFRHSPRGRRGPRCPDGPRTNRCPEEQVLTDPTSLPVPRELSAGGALGSRKGCGKGPSQTLLWPQGVSRGSVGRPRLGERALDQAQDDLMGKKCPQEENQALTAKTLRLITASSPLSPCRDRGGRGPGLAGRPSWAPNRRGGPGRPHCPLGLAVSVSASLTRLQPHPSSGGLSLQQSACPGG